MAIIPRKENLVEKLKYEYISIGGLGLNFQRTCRVPQGKINSLPAGLGSFPVFKVSDFRYGAPKEWKNDGYFMPMYRQEAMWISFARGYMQNPKAVIVGAGNINAVNGKPFSKKGRGKSSLDIKLEKEQNYLVVPPQPWLDGWKAEDNKIYQFVAAEMGSGETVEGQVTGKEIVGGIQLVVYDPKKGQKLVHSTRPHEYIIGGSWDSFPTIFGGFSGPYCFALGSKAMPIKKNFIASVRSMGLGRGGEIEQKIYSDPHGLEVWNEKPTASDIIYLVSSEDFKKVTRYDAPPTPVTYEKYQQFGLPWFELHDKKYQDTKGSPIFEKLKPVGEGKTKSKLLLKGGKNESLLFDKRCL